jgi:Flp pilus assembly protein TadG
MNFRQRSLRIMPALWDDETGSIAAMFALCALALTLTSGLAIDYSRSANVHTSLQNDLDAALLAAAATAEDLPDIKNVAQKYIGDNWKNRYGVAENVSLAIKKPTARTLQGSTTVRVPTTLMALAGFKHLEVNVSSEIELTSKDIEIALVLDVTDSMMGTKIEALKTSAASLIDKAYEQPKSTEHIRVAIVPFADYVNVGEVHRNESWIDVPLDTETTSETCVNDYREVTGTTNCRMQPYSYDRDGVTISGESQVCDYEYGPPQSRCFSNTHSVRWYGCVASREYPLDAHDENWEVPVPAAMNVGCGAPGMTLTNDIDALKQRIGEITTFGNTYIPSGLFWGWTVLSPGEPFGDARGYGEKIDGAPIEKVMVLMTDGANTRSPDYVAKNHSSGDVDLANERTAELCSNIKKKGIKIYTVAFDVGDAAIKEILRTCATSSSHFFDADDAAELETAFTDIGASLSPLRIAR